jgi:hemolysin type calcium-binding protein
VRKLAILTVLVAVMVAAFTTAAYADIVTGTNQDDRLKGTSERDQINGLYGDDTIWGKAQTDEVFGGRGSDEIFGGWASDWLVGGRDSDTLWGGKGRDEIEAADGYRDKIHCGPNVDIVFADTIDRVSDDCEDVHRVNTREV